MRGDGQGLAPEIQPISLSKPHPAPGFPHHFAGYFPALVSLHDWSLWLQLPSCFSFGILHSPSYFRVNISLHFIFECDSFGTIHSVISMELVQKRESGRGEGHRLRWQVCHNQVFRPSVWPHSCWLLLLWMFLRFLHCVSSWGPQLWFLDVGLPLLMTIPC